MCKTRPGHAYEFRGPLVYESHLCTILLVNVTLHKIIRAIFESMKLCAFKKQRQQRQMFKSLQEKRKSVNCGVQVRFKTLNKIQLGKGCQKLGTAPVLFRRKKGNNSTMTTQQLPQGTHTATTTTPTPLI